MSGEFSRRVDVELIKAEPMSLTEFAEAATEPYDDVPALEAAYRLYLDRFQPYRWRAIAANNEPIAHGESYFNQADCVNAIELLCGDNTTIYWAPMFGEDRGFRWLRYGATDRGRQAE